jgi:hypothetical protein
MQLRTALILGTLTLVATGTCEFQVTEATIMAKDVSGSASGGASTDGSAANLTEGSSAAELDYSPCPSPKDDKEGFISCVKRKAKQPAPKEWVADDGKNAPWNNFGKCPDQKTDPRGYDKCMAEFWKKNGEPLDKQCSDFTKGSIEFNICSSELLSNDLVETSSSSGSDQSFKKIGDTDELDNFDPKKDDKKNTENTAGSSSSTTKSCGGLAAGLTMIAAVAVLNLP